MAGCGDLPGAALEPTSATTQPIEQGAPCGAYQFAETGAVLSKEGWVADSVCTGTLIAPDVVLTAAHCADANVPQIFVPEPRALRGGGHFAVPVVRSSVHPAYRKPLLEGGVPRNAEEQAAMATLRQVCGMQNERLVDDAWRACLLNHLPEDVMQILGLVSDLRERHDVALLYLREPLTGASVAALAAPDDVLTVGTAVDIVGYGVHGRAGLLNLNKGVRHWGRTVIQSVGDHEFITEGQAYTCGGDSGAPAFLPELQAGVRRLMGVASQAYYDTSGQCAGASVFARVDTNRAFIEAGLQQGASLDTVARFVMVRS